MTTMWESLQYALLGKHLDEIIDRLDVDVERLQLEKEALIARSSYDPETDVKARILEAQLNLILRLFGP